MVDFSEYDEGFAVVPPAATIPTASVIPNGFYTLAFPDGSHKTFRIHTKTEDAKFAPGKRVLSLLIGPENTSDYEGFAFVDDNGITVWKRFKHARQTEYARLLWMLTTGCEAEGYELLVSRRCLRCNRPLTQPHAIEAGIGDECLRILSGSR